MQRMFLNGNVPRFAPHITLIRSFEWEGAQEELLEVIRQLSSAQKTIPIEFCCVSRRSADCNSPRPSGLVFRVKAPLPYASERLRSFRRELYEALLPRIVGDPHPVFKPHLTFSSVLNGEASEIKAALTGKTLPATSITSLTLYSGAEPRECTVPVTTFSLGEM